MWRAALAGAVAVAAAGPAAPPAADAAARTSTVCQTDGVAQLCVSSLDEQDTVGIVYQVTQLDGPGTYTIEDVSQSTGATSNPTTVGPLAYQGTASGTLYAGQNACYNVELTSAAGTSLVAGPVCG
jgi:hypothetical protein